MPALHANEISFPLDKGVARPCLQAPGRYPRLLAPGRANGFDPAGTGPRSAATGPGRGEVLARAPVRGGGRCGGLPSGGPATPGCPLVPDPRAPGSSTWQCGRPPAGEPRPLAHGRGRLQPRMLPARGNFPGGGREPLGALPAAAAGEMLAAAAEPELLSSLPAPRRAGSRRASHTQTAGERRGIGVGWLAGRSGIMCSRRSSSCSARRRGPLHIWAGAARAQGRALGGGGRRSGRLGSPRAGPAATPRPLTGRGV